MQTPIVDFVEGIAKSPALRFCMPGHKGRQQFPAKLPFIEPYDITEIYGADALYLAEGIIAASEQNAARLFGAAHTCYSTQGSTLCIQAMVYLMRQRGRKIIASRGAHLSFINSCMLLGVEVVWLLPEQQDRYGVFGCIHKAQVDEACTNNKDACAVYVTSPDYLGNVCDIVQIAQVCQAHQIPLLWDNAHGAYLKFGKQDLHPLALGATMCCDSAHKTLPVLTGGAYLHIAKNAPFSKQQAKYAMGMFGSTSPSYLTLCSLDQCNQYLYERANQDFTTLHDRIVRFKEELDALGVLYLQSKIDYAKLTIDARALGQTGHGLSEYFASQQILCEYASEDFMVLLFSPSHQQEDFARILDAIRTLSASRTLGTSRTLSASRTLGASEPRSEPIERAISCCQKPTYKMGEIAVAAHQALFCKTERISIEHATNRVAGEVIAHCPPGVPLVVPGERIDIALQQLLKNSGIVAINVLK